MEIDCWPSKSEAVSVFTSANSNSSSSSHVNHDESVISIFTQSIEIFGSSMAPWPASSKSIQEQVAGIFITSESSCTKDETVQSRLEANKPQIQSKLRRSSSGSRRVSVTRINEEHFFDSQIIYSKLEPIPIVTVERKLSMISTTKEKDDEAFEAQKERNSKSSRLQNWLSSLYARSNSKTPTKDEESGFGSSSFDQKPLKSILKNTSVLEVQKSASIPETEAIKISSDGKPKKSIKIRFDNEVSVCETFHKEDYCRQSLDYVARQLTPSLALAIKKELNSVKQEMEVHEDARHLTQFYLIK
jgi:hypothetical protein